MGASSLDGIEAQLAETAADVLVNSLVDWGVQVVFGLPGDGINGIVEGLRKRQDKIRFVQLRHEESAALMACAYAKWTGRLGCCLATSGPGGIHLLNGLYDAKLDGAPVLAITGLQFHDLVHTYTQQDVELDKLFVDVAVYNTRIMGAAHVRNAMELACRTALAYRGVAHVTMPVDLQSLPVGADPRSERNIAGHVSNLMSDSAHMPRPSEIERAAAVLNAGKSVCILAGRGALGARPELEETVELLGAPVATALLGKGAVPDDSPFATGGVGLLGTKPSQEALENCDTLLIVGSSFPYVEFYPKPGSARCVQIDFDPKRIGLRYPVEVGLIGGAAQTLRLLIPVLKRKENRAFLERAQQGMAEWRQLLEERASREERPMKPQVVAHQLGRLIDDDAIVATDSGTVTTWCARHVPIRADRKFACSGTLATMACGLPYAIAAAIAYPERQVVAVVGDGGLSMLMAELATCVKYDLNVKIVVIKNNSLGQIKWEQIVFLGNPEFGCELQPINFAEVARACGLHAFTIEDPSQCADVLRGALAMRGPVLVEAVVDPHEPPMPPKVTLKQMTRFAEALARGTPHRGKIALTVASDVVREIV
jgi:pyruvate dehydrogenase (quinone)/pyruvate oxidase